MIIKDKRRIKLISKFSIIDPKIKQDGRIKIASIRFDLSHFLEQI